MNNTSGELPVEYKVLLKTDSIERTTRGGLYIPDHIREKEQRERVVAELVAFGGRAFQDPPWGDPIPKAGDRVRVARYAGFFFIGKDDQTYQLCQDKDICSIVNEEGEKRYSDTDQPDYAGDGVYGHLRSK